MNSILHTTFLTTHDYLKVKTKDNILLVDSQKISSQVWNKSGWTDNLPLNGSGDYQDYKLNEDNGTFFTSPDYVLYQSLENSR